MFTYYLKVSETIYKLALTYRKLKMVETDLSFFVESKWLWIRLGKFYIAAALLFIVEWKYGFP